jgi:phage tail sheath protein FI
VPKQLTHPGVYVEEIPSGVRTIVGVATSITAFAGRASRGPTAEPVQISSYEQFVEQFGGLWEPSRLGFAVRDYYLHGGSQALIARVYVPPDGGDGRTRVVLGAGAAAVRLVAVSPGGWGNGLRAVADHANLDDSPQARFNLTITDIGSGRSERIVGVSLYSDDARRIDHVLERESQLVRLDGPVLAPPAAGANRVRPAAGIQDKASDLEGDAAKAAEAVTPKLAELPAKRADLSSAEVKLAKAEQDGRDADAEKVAAVAASDQLKQRVADLKKAHTAADKAVNDAKALPDTDPTKVGRLARAEAAAKAAKDALDAAESGLTEAEKRVAAADPVISAAAQAVTDATTARQGAADALAAAVQAVDAAKAAAQAEADKVAGAFGADAGDDGKVPATATAFWDAAAALLGSADLFNLLCIPPYRGRDDVEPEVYDKAAQFCLQHRAMLLVDAPSGWTDAAAARTGFLAEPDQVGARGAGRTNAALFFPRLRQPNPNLGGAVEDFVPCGAVAGVFARTDTRRGVWKAPAGLEAALPGARDLSVRLTDDGQGLLNPLGVNCLRSFPVVGRVVWGSRTLAGADVLASEWKHVPIRRLALFIEESLFRGTQWVVFEPNDEPLWAQIRLNVGAFMHDLFRQGAFAGVTPRDAYLVRCDKDTTTQSDQNKGIVNIVVGFAPVRPAEFVVIRLQQLAGQIQV